MKRELKGFLCGVLATILCFGAVAFAANYEAVAAGFKVFVNGEEFHSDPPALVVEGRTYLPLRAMGDALGVPVNWNDELGQAEVGTPPQSGAVKYYPENKRIPDFGAIMNIEPDYVMNEGKGTIGYRYIITDQSQFTIDKALSIYKQRLKSGGFEISSISDGLEMYENGQGDQVAIAIPRSDFVGILFNGPIE